MKKALFLLTSILAFTHMGYAQLDSLTFETDSVYVDSMPGIDFDDMVDSALVHITQGRFDMVYN